jgi:hypothetical protein
MNWRSRLSIGGARIVKTGLIIQEGRLFVWFLPHSERPPLEPEAEFTQKAVPVIMEKQNRRQFIGKLTFGVAASGPVLALRPMITEAPSADFGPVKYNLWAPDTVAPDLQRSTPWRWGRRERCTRWGG